MIAHNEQFQCRTCHHIGPLTVHGRCESCNSDSVITQEVFRGMTILDLHALADRVMEQVSREDYDA